MPASDATPTSEQLVHDACTAYASKGMRITNLAVLALCCWAIFLKPPGFAAFFAPTHALVSLVFLILPHVDAYITTEPQRKALLVVFTVAVVGVVGLSVSLFIALVVGVDDAARLPLYYIAATKLSASFVTK